MRIPEDSSDALQEFAAQDLDGQQRAKDLLEHAMNMKKLGYRAADNGQGGIVWVKDY